MHLFSMKKVEVTSSFTIAFTIKAIGNKGQVLGRSVTSRALELPQGSHLRVSATHEGFSTIAYTIEAIRDGQLVDTREFQETLELPRDTSDITVSVQITE